MSKELEEHFRVHQRRLLKTLFYIHPNGEDVEDVLQNAFIKALRSYSQYDKNKASLGTWFHRIMVSELWDFLKSKRRRAILSQDIQEFPVEDPNPPDVTAEIEKLLETVANERHRKVLYNHLVLGMTYPEIEKITGVKSGACNMIVNRFRWSLED